MKVWLISDTHFNHRNIATYCNRPEDFTDRIIKNWNANVKPEDTIIHLGDVAIGRNSAWIMPSLPGTKILVRGNHDRDHSCTWWMENGFHFACDGMKFRNVWITHEPSTSLCDGAELNVHGHLHNFMDKSPEERIKASHGVYKPKPFHRLFAVEYTEYRPVEFDKFVSHPDKYKSIIK